MTEDGNVHDKGDLKRTVANDSGNKSYDTLLLLPLFNNCNLRRKNPFFCFRLIFADSAFAEASISQTQTGCVQATSGKRANLRRSVKIGRNGLFWKGRWSREQVLIYKN